MKLTPELAKAIEKAVAKPAKNANFAVGAHAIDEIITLRVHGTLNKSKDEEFTPTAEIPLKAALALVLEKAGVVGDAAANILVAAMTEALEKSASKDAALQARMKDVDVAMERVQKAAAALPAKTRAGKLTAKVVVEEVA